MKFFLILLFLLIGCSKQASTRLELSTSYVVSGASGGLLLQLKNLTTSKKETIVLSENSINLMLEGENWEFTAIAWDGGANLNGNVKCAHKAVTLTPPSMKVELNPTIAGCDDDYFSPATYRVSNITRELRVINCKNISSITPGSNCDSTSRGYGESYQVRLLGKGTPLASGCLPASAPPMSTSNTGLKIPFGSPQFSLETEIVWFQDASCNYPLKRFFFPNGLAQANPGNSVTHPYAAYADVFFKTTYVSISPISSSSEIFGSPYSTSITLTNLTDAAITSFSFQLPAGMSFVGGAFPGTSGTCTMTLAIGANCTLNIQVTPPASGLYNLPLIVNYFNGSQSSTIVPTSITFETPANLNFGVSSHNFGNVLVNTKKSQTFTVTNTGQRNASGLAYTFTGADAADFTHTSSCSTSLPAGSSCSVIVIAAPGKEGSLNANFQVSYNNSVISVNTVLPVSTNAKDLYVTNGTVETLLVSGNTLYLGGSFKNLARRSGGGIMTRAGTCDATACLDANYADLGGVPKVAGTVKASVSDGAGGFYIGGDFTHVGSFPRANLAHILMDGSVDPSFTVGTDATGAVTALAMSGTTLYVAGQFSTLGGFGRIKLGAIDTTANSITAFNPNPNNFVYTMLANGSTLYVGGAFTMIGGQTRNRLAAIDTATNAVTSWDPNVMGSQVQALSVWGSYLFLGGTFTAVGGMSRNNLARVDITTAVVDSWNPMVDNMVLALANDGTNLYVGGMFSTLNGSSRGKLGSYNMSTLTLNSLNGSFNDQVAALYSDPVTQTLYVGGRFTQSGASVRNGGASFSTVTQALTGFNPDLNDSVQTISQSGTALFVGGQFTGMSVVPRSLIAAIDLNTGAPTPFNVSVTGSSVFTLAEAGGTLYFGGQFSNVSGQTRGHIAAVDSATGAIRAFNPVADNDVYSIALDGSTVIAGGAFYNIGGASRTHLAVLDSTTGAATGFNAVLNPGYVKSVVTDGSDIYFGGSFTNVNGMTRNNVASVDKIAGTTTTFDVNASNPVKEVVLDGPAAYLIGSFATIGPDSRNFFAAVDSVIGSTAALNPNPSAAVNDIFLSGSHLFLAGNFTTVSGQGRPGLAMIDTSVGTPTALSVTPPPSYTGKSVTAANGIVFFGGQFKSMNGQARGNLYLSSTP